MQFYYIIANIRLVDILDIIFLTILSYHLYLWFRGTKAYRALIGLLALGIAFTLARTWGLFLTTWVFQIFWQVLIILLIILFQSEIRQVLESVNPLQAISLRKSSLPEKWIPAFSYGVFSLAKKQIGALIIIERRDRVEEFITEGQYLEGDPSPELILSIFQKESPLHDGAVLIQRGRITQVACYLPLSAESNVPKEWGTRHRAALGLSERCDALVIVVSEERGQVSIVVGKKLRHVENQGQLSNIITEAIRPYSPWKISWQERLRSFFIKKWQIKLGTLCLVTMLWLLLAGQQDFEATISIPLGIKDLPPAVEILEPLDPRVKIKVRGFRKDVSILNEKNVSVKIDMSSASSGKTTLSINREHISLPNDKINVVNIEPNQFKFEFK